jgi:hypothetical protein
LSSGAAPSGVFGTDYFAYFMQPEWFEVRHEFIPDGNALVGFAQALGAAIASSGIAIVLGDAMRKVRR